MHIWVNMKHANIVRLSAMEYFSEHFTFGLISEPVYPKNLREYLGLLSSSSAESFSFPRGIDFFVVVRSNHFQYTKNCYS